MEKDAQTEIRGCIVFLGKLRLSRHEFSRGFLQSETAELRDVPDISGDPDLSIASGRVECEYQPKHLQASFRRIALQWRSWSEVGFVVPDSALILAGTHAR